MAKDNPSCSSKLTKITYPRLQLPTPMALPQNIVTFRQEKKPFPLLSCRRRRQMSAIGRPHGWHAKGSLRRKSRNGVGNGARNLTLLIGITWKKILYILAPYVKQKLTLPLTIVIQADRSIGEVLIVRHTMERFMKNRLVKIANWLGRKRRVPGYARKNNT